MPRDRGPPEREDPARVRERLQPLDEAGEAQLVLRLGLHPSAKVGDDRRAIPAGRLHERARVTVLGPGLVPELRPVPDRRPPNRQEGYPGGPSRAAHAPGPKARFEAPSSPPLRREAEQALEGLDELDREGIAQRQDPIDPQSAAGIAELDQVDLANRAGVVDPPVRCSRSARLERRGHELRFGKVPVLVGAVVGIPRLIGVRPVLDPTSARPAMLQAEFRRSSALGLV